MSSPGSSPSTHEASLARDLGLFDATMIGVGAMIGAGIFVLTGIAAGQAGPASILAFALNGGVTLLTAFAYAELASAIPRAGGGYSFVRMAFPGAVGFTAGWMLWFAYTVACSLYALGFAGYFWEFFLKYAPGVADMIFGLTGHHTAVLVMAVFAGIAFIGLNVRGAEVTGRAENVLTISKLVVLAIFVSFGLRTVFGAPTEAAAHFNPFFPRGMGGVLVAMGLTFIAFEGYDLIATVAEEIKEPEKNIPRATFIALTITVILYLLILFVSLGAVRGEGMPSWQFLGNYKETAIVRAAEDFMPAFGVAIIVFGGLLSTMSALNATVMAASRVAFSMGRDKMLPQAVAKIDPKRRTPAVAIVATGAILLVLAVSLPLEAVGSAASLIFLLTFAMVNLSVIVLRRKAPEIPRRYRVPLYPVVPALGFGLNIFLALYQFKFQPIAWYVTIGWVVAGLIVYFALFRTRAAAELPQVLVPAFQAARPTDRYTVVVPLSNPETVGRLLELAAPIAREHSGHVVAVSVVQVPRQLPIHEGLRFRAKRAALLEEARRYAAERGIDLDTDLVVAHHVQDGILNAAERLHADLLVMGWKGFSNTRERIFGEVVDHVIRHAVCNLMLLKIMPNGKLLHVLYPTAGGPHAKLAAEYLGALSRDRQLAVSTCYVVPAGATSEVRTEADRLLEEAADRLGEHVTVTKKLLTSDSVSDAIAEASRDYDLVVLGAAREPWFRKILFGEIPEQVARLSPASVLVVKRYEGRVKSLLKRILG